MRAARPRSDNGRPTLRQGNVTGSEIPHSRQRSDHATNQPIDTATRAAGRCTDRDLHRAGPGKRSDQRLHPRRAERSQSLHRNPARLAASADAVGRARHPSEAQHDAGGRCAARALRQQLSRRAAAGGRTASGACGRCGAAGAVRHEQEVAHGRGVRHAHGGVAHARRPQHAVGPGGQRRRRDDGGLDGSQHPAAADESHRRSGEWPLAGDDAGGQAPRRVGEERLGITGRDDRIRRARRFR